MFCVAVHHPGFVNRFLTQPVPPRKPGMEVGWCTSDTNRIVMTFGCRADAEKVIATYQTRFLEEGLGLYKFVLMEQQMQPVWREVN